MRKILQLVSAVTVVVALAAPAAAQAVKLEGPAGPLPIGAQVTFTSGPFQMADGIATTTCASLSFTQSVVANTSYADLVSLGDATVGNCSQGAIINQLTIGRTLLSATQGASVNSCMKWRQAFTQTGHINYTPQVGSSTLPIASTPTSATPIAGCGGIWAFPQISGQFEMTDQNGAPVTLQN